MSLKAPKGFIDEADSRVAKFGHPAPAWLFPYADLMTEMVCFFVILYSLSAALDPELQKAKGKAEEVMKEEKLPGEVKMTQEGLELTLSESKKGDISYFQSGQADLSEKLIGALEKLAPILNSAALTNHEIVVQGHTDDVPIHDEYFWSNWELSTARATTVVEHPTSKRGLPPGCMAAMGFGEFRPLCGEKTPECRAKNRRIVILVRNPPLSKDLCAGGTAGGGDSAGAGKAGGVEVGASASGAPSQETKSEAAPEAGPGTPAAEAQAE